MINLQKDLGNATDDDYGDGSDDYVFYLAAKKNEKDVGETKRAFWSKDNSVPVKNSEDDRFMGIAPFPAMFVRLKITMRRPQNKNGHGESGSNAFYS